VTADDGGITETGVFKAAGSIVPEPSIMSLAIPLIAVEAGWGAVYITTSGSTARWPAESSSSHRPRWRAIAPAAGRRPRTAIMASAGTRRVESNGARALACTPGANEIHEA
jgi:hypothetical protein